MSYSEVDHEMPTGLDLPPAPAITVTELGKCFHIYERPRQRLQQLMLAPIRSRIKGAEVKYYREFWALKNINFQVNRGETVGIKSSVAHWPPLRAR
jgi:ABC-type glutathione transport system ATPase component